MSLDFVLVFDGKQINMNSFKINILMQVVKTHINL